MHDIAVPAETGTHEVHGFEVTVEATYDDKTFDGRYDARKIGSIGGIKVYEDDDGDYWIGNTSRSDENYEDSGYVLVGEHSEFFGIIEAELGE